MHNCIPEQYRLQKLPGQRCRPKSDGLYSHRISKNENFTHTGGLPVNILLIYPEFPDTFWSFKHALKFTGKRALLPPLGLLTVAAMLPSNWSVRLVDTIVHTLRQIDLDWADFAFISAMAVQRESAQRIISRCKQNNLRIVAGGPLFTAEHKQFDTVDHFVLGEAELTFPLFLSDLDRGIPLRVYRRWSVCCRPRPVRGFMSASNERGVFSEF
jgi:radical SAM superfamily enzyme YgiQ (UPF0313 family)